jgi:hypothetical protein
VLPFEFDGPDQVHLVGVVCTLKRTTSTTPGGAASALPASQTNPAAAAAPASGAAKPAPPTSSRSPLEKFNFRRGYDCPDGQADVVVDSCTSEAPDGTCVVVRVDQPLKNGGPVTFTETDRRIYEARRQLSTAADDVSQR